MRSEVTRALSDYPSAVRYAAMMSSSELLENAVKYGEPVGTTDGIVFELKADPALVEITVANGTTHDERVQELRRHVHDITAAQDRSAMYFGRLRELVSRPSESSKLGVYRVVFEGEFDLDVHFADNVVTVHARRVVG